MKIANEECHPSRRDLLYERVYSYLKHAILYGLLEQGRHLVETKIAEQLGISRTPIREAIHKLEQEGFVYKRPNGGHAVSLINEINTREMRDIIGIILGYSAYLAALNATIYDLVTLRDIRKNIEKYQRARTREMVVNEVCRLYDTMLVLSNNYYLCTIFNGFRRNFVRKLLDDHTIKRRPTFFKYHMTLIDLMEAKKATRAERLTRKLILKMLCFDEKHT